MRKVKLGFAIGLNVTLLVASSLQAYPNDFGPFAEREEPPRCPVAQWHVVAEQGPVVHGWRQTLVYGSPAEQALRVEAIVPEAYPAGIEIAVLDTRGFRIAGPVAASNPEIQVRPKAIYSADLNGDGKPDFLVPLQSGGSGLGGDAANLVILLSSGSQFRFWLVPTMAPGPEDFVALPGQAGCTIIKSSYVHNGQPQNSRRRHSYWVFNLVAVRGDRLVLANELDARFPKWVWYTDSSNHKPVGSLSPEDKLAIWNASGEIIAREVGR